MNKIIITFFIYINYILACSCSSVVCECASLEQMQFKIFEQAIGTKFDAFNDALNKELETLKEINEVLLKGIEDEKVHQKVFARKECALRKILFELNKYSQLLKIESQVDSVATSCTQNKKDL